MGLEPIIKTDNDVMLLFSGGHDSVLAAARLASEGKRVHLITFNVGGLCNVTDREFGIRALTDKFNTEFNELIVDCGARNIFGVWQLLMRPLFDKPFSSIVSEDCGVLTISESYSLIVRTAMVVSAGILCKNKGFKRLACGDKMGDDLASHHSNVFDLHKGMLSDMFQVEYDRPIWNVPDEFEVKSELMLRGLSTTAVRPRDVFDCLSFDTPPGRSVQADQAAASVFSKILYPVIERSVEMWKSVLKD